MRRMIAILLLTLSSMALMAQQQPSSNADSKQETRSTPAQAGPASDDIQEGAKLFATHCGRCHQPPQDLSPKAVPTVVMHMRNRALLSAEDADRIVRFLAPGSRKSH